MNHRQIYKLYELVEGDRFYFNGDEKKLVQVLLQTQSCRSTTTQDGYTYTCAIRPATVHDNMQDPTQPYPAYDRHIKKAETRQVVFLRHKEAIA